MVKATRKKNQRAGGKQPFSIICRLLLGGIALMLSGASSCAQTQPRSALLQRPELPSPSTARLKRADPDYKLSAGDLIVVEMFEHDEMQTSQRLTNNGEIRLPLIGRVSLSDLTVREAETRIEQMFKAGGYFVDPQIILFVQQYAERFVSVMGEVRNPARIPLPEESNSLGILQAVTLAGGFTRIARTDAVQVSRTNADGVEERFTIDVRDLLKGRRRSELREFQLVSGDVVFVPERTL